MNAYPEVFYDNQISGSRRSAYVILSHLFEFYQPQSLVDVGCGRGAWLAAAESLGVQSLRGLDGSWVHQYGLISKNIEFTPANLEENLDLGQQYDLCISVEVAEHISKDKANQFIESLCNISKVVLFSAAIKGQGGRDHINEQPQSYWIKLFENCGYECLDIIRPAIWDNDDVDWWYKQNIFLFYERTFSLKFDSLKNNEKIIYDLVHPEHLQIKINRFEKVIKNPTISFIAGRVWHFVRNFFKQKR